MGVQPLTTNNMLQPFAPRGNPTSPPESAERGPLRLGKYVPCRDEALGFDLSPTHEHVPNRGFSGGVIFLAN